MVQQLAAHKTYVGNWKMLTNNSTTVQSVKLTSYSKEPFSF